MNEIQQLQNDISRHVIGQEKLISRLLIALLADGHLLVEGAPGLAKTKVIKHLMQGIEASFHRIQFTPDLLPADITGTDIFHPNTGTFSFEQGPIFHNLILADEINRAPAKVQSALLEAMAEHQVTIGKTTYPLPPLFLVMATQNAIEHEGTYPLPEAQLDRFQMYIQIDYPNATAEKQILHLARSEFLQTLQKSESIDKFKLSQQAIFSARAEVAQLHVSANIEDYIIQLIMATREPNKYDATLSQWIRNGASPRGTIALERCAKAHAWLEGRDYVSPHDVQAVFVDVLGHRLIRTFEAMAEGITNRTILEHILNKVAVA